MRVDVRVLGNVEVRRGPESVAIGGPKPRQILAMLVAAHGAVVSTDRLEEELWGDNQPADPGAVLQSNISRLRKVLHPDAQIVSRPPGYALEIDPSAVDAWRFEANQLAARADVSPAALIESNERALTCFSGQPYAEFADREWARAEVSRLEELRTVAREEVLSARLALGEDRTIVADLEALVSEHPLRERPWHELAVALYRSGRSADALRRIATFRTILREELGLDPPVAIRATRDTDPRVRSGAARRSGAADRPSLASAPGRGHIARRAQRRPGGHRRATSASIGSSPSSGPAGWARPAWRCGSRRRVGRTPRRGVRGGVGARPRSAVDGRIGGNGHRRAPAPVPQRRGHARRVPARPARAARARQLRAPAAGRGPPRRTDARGVPRPDGAGHEPGGARSARRARPAGGAARRGDEFDVRSTNWRRSPRSGCSSSGPRRRPRASRSTPTTRRPWPTSSRRVDGLPLAIELAAARSSAISPAALAERLRDRFDLLDHAQAGRSERHQTLTELVAWSFNLLNGAEQILFARLSVFAGSFGLDAVETICTDESLDASSAARVLAALVDKSMVQLSTAPAATGCSNRCASSGAAELRESERAAVTERHSSWYLALAERSAESMAGPDEPAAAARLDREFGNLRAAFSYFAEQGDVERCAMLVVALREYSFRSMRAEVISWADEVIAMPGFDESPRAPLVLATAAYGRFVRGDLDSSIEFADRSVAASRRLGVGSSGLAERALGNSWFYRGEAEVAQQWIDRMLDDAGTGSPARLTHALYMRSVASTSVGDPRTRRRLRRPGARRRPPVRLADGDGAGACTRSDCRSKSSDPPAAAEHLQRAAEVAAGAGNRWVQAFALTEVLSLEARQGSSLPRWPGSPT